MREQTRAREGARGSEMDRSGHRREVPLRPALRAGPARWHHPVQAHEQAAARHHL